MHPDFFVGLDLGQARDYTALVVVERVVFVPASATQRTPSRAFIGGPAIAAPVAKPTNHYHVRHCDRPRLGTSYPDVVRLTRSVLSVLSSLEGALIELVVDATGVGRPVVDLFEEQGVYPIAVTLTGGDGVGGDTRSLRVPKRDLVSTLEVLLQEHKLRIARDMDHSGALVDELLNFRASVRTSGRDAFEAAAGSHDDLVIALGLACWRARATEREPAKPVTGVSKPWEDSDDADALWLGNPENRYLGGRRGGSRFLPGAGGISSPQIAGVRYRMIGRR